MTGELGKCCHGTVHIGIWNEDVRVQRFWAERKSVVLLDSDLAVVWRRDMMGP